MPAASHPLDNIRVASPCPAAWDQMEGDDRVRFCRECGLNVYNLSEMSGAEAKAVLRTQAERLCVRFYRRRDGTLLTQDCPVGFRHARRWLLTHVAALSGVFAAIPGLAWAAAGYRSWPVWRWEPIRPTAERLGILPRPNPFVMMGGLAAPPPPARRPATRRK